MWIVQNMPAPALPLYEKIAASIARHIDAGTMRPGDRVPSVRRASLQHGVSVSTVTQAYLALENRGLIHARPKSGFFVRPRVLDHIPAPKTSRPRKGLARIGSGDLRSRILEIASQRHIVPLGAAAPAPELLPVTRLNRVMASASRHARASALEYSHPAGCEELRRELARRSLDWGCNLEPEDFIVTSGTMEALFLSLRATTKPGDVVVVES
ncbi:MAG TPA: GntR family transcriptional regulator, partial [Candidatus Binatia bacterium]|nr:GntR family transcriptional regulator [Candidatus Binatia bacterium]